MAELCFKLSFALSLRVDVDGSYPLTFISTHKPRNRKLRSIEASEESWDLGKYWPSFIPAPIRIHSAEEVEQLAIMRRKKLQDKMNPRPKQKDEEEKPR